MNKRVILSLLAMLFFGPVIVAWIWFFYLAEPSDFETVNKGQLIDPVVAMADVQLAESGAAGLSRVFDEDWSIVLIAPNGCDHACIQALFTTRQVWRRLNRDMDRVQRVFLAGNGVTVDRAEHPLLHVYELSPELQRRFIDAVPRHDPAGRVFLVDPRGNLMMSYPLDLDPKMLFDDLRRLLRYSQEG